MKLTPKHIKYINFRDQMCNAGNYVDNYIHWNLVDHYIYWDLVGHIRDPIENNINHVAMNIKGHLFELIN